MRVVVLDQDNLVICNGYTRVGRGNGCGWCWGWPCARSWWPRRSVTLMRSSGYPAGRRSPKYGRHIGNELKNGKRLSRSNPSVVFNSWLSGVTWICLKINNLRINKWRWINVFYSTDFTKSFNYFYCAYILNKVFILFYLKLNKDYNHCPMYLAVSNSLNIKFLFFFSSMFNCHIL